MFHRFQRGRGRGNQMRGLLDDAFQGNQGWDFEPGLGGGGGGGGGGGAAEMEEDPYSNYASYNQDFMGNRMNRKRLHGGTEPGRFVRPRYDELFEPIEPEAQLLRLQQQKLLDMEEEGREIWNTMPEQNEMELNMMNQGSPGPRIPRVMREELLRQQGMAESRPQLLGRPPALMGSAPGQSPLLSGLQAPMRGHGNNRGRGAQRPMRGGYLNSNEMAKPVKPSLLGDHPQQKPLLSKPPLPPMSLLGDYPDREFPLGSFPPNAPLLGKDPQGPSLLGDFPGQQFDFSHPPPTNDGYSSYLDRHASLVPNRADNDQSLNFQGEAQFAKQSRQKGPRDDGQMQNGENGMLPHVGRFQGNQGRGGNQSNRGGNQGNRGGNQSNMGGNRGGNQGSRGGNQSNRGGNQGNRGGNQSNMGGNMFGNQGNMGGNQSNRGGNQSNRGGNQSNRGGDQRNRGGNQANRGGNQGNMGGQRLENQWSREDKQDNRGENRRGGRGGNRGGNQSIRGGSRGDNQGNRGGRGGNQGNRGGRSFNQGNTRGNQGSMRGNQSNRGGSRGDLQGGNQGDWGDGQGGKKGNRGDGRGGKQGNKGGKDGGKGRNSKRDKKAEEREQKRLIDEQVEEFRQSLLSPLTALIDSIQQAKIVFDIPELKNALSPHKGIFSEGYFTQHDHPTDPSKRVLKCELYLNHIFLSSSEITISQLVWEDLTSIQSRWAKSNLRKTLLNKTYKDALQVLMFIPAAIISTNHEVLMPGEEPEGYFDLAVSGFGKQGNTNRNRLDMMSTRDRQKDLTQADLVIMLNEEWTMEKNAFSILTKSASMSGLLLEWDFRLVQMRNLNFTRCTIMLNGEELSEGMGLSRPLAKNNAAKLAMDKFCVTQPTIKILQQDHSVPKTSWLQLKARAEAWIPPPSAIKAASGITSGDTCFQDDPMEIDSELQDQSGMPLGSDEALLPVNERVVQYVTRTLEMRASEDSLSEVYIGFGVPLAERLAINKVAKRLGFRLKSDIKSGRDLLLMAVRDLMPKEMLACLRRNNRRSGRYLLVNLGKNFHM